MRPSLMGRANRFRTTPSTLNCQEGMDADTAVVLETGGAANCVCFMRLGRRISILERWGVRRTETYYARAHFEFGDSRLGEVRCAVEILAGTAGGRRKFTAFALEADIPALSRKGASEALVGS